MKPVAHPVTPFLDPRAVSEAQFQDVVIGYARARGWLVHHDRPSQNAAGRWSTAIQGDAGFPDLVLAREDAIVMLELKRQSGRLTPQQRVWLAALGWRDNAGSVIVYPGEQLVVGVVKPSDWPAVARVLA